MKTIEMANKTNRIYNDIMCRLFKYMLHRKPENTSYHEALSMFRYISHELYSCSTILQKYLLHAEE